MTMNRAVFVVIVIFVTCIGALVGCQAEPTPTPTPMVWDMHNSRPLAERFLENSRTFVYDGIRLSIELVTIDRQSDICDTCFVYHFTFRTTHAGYGDRAGQILPQVITDHTVAITTQRGMVTAGVIDEKWDMLAQRYLPGTGP